MVNTVPCRCSWSRGEIIDKKYVVERVLGEGSYGKVYSVIDIGNKQRYALKLLKLWEVHPGIREGLIARFEMEFETGRIQSDYLVHSVTHGIVEGNPYIVMEFCPGGDLANSKQEMDFSKVAMHILLGLKALHSCGKVHRDLKPENVLIKENGDYVLTDFGISGDRNKRMTKMNIFGEPKEMFGTYAYMSPEQLDPRRDATVLPTTDLFSFGVLMYQLITGQLPFGNLDVIADISPYTQKVKSGDWNRDLLKQKQGECDWLSLIEGCLMPDFRKRLQTVDDVIKMIPDVIPLQQTIRPDRTQIFQKKIVRGVLLRIMQGEEFGRTYELESLLVGNCAMLSVGRKDAIVRNSIEIKEELTSYISRMHCTLERDRRTGKWYIRDGQWDKNSTSGWKVSTNGTYVNSTVVPIDGIPFEPGDIISIGDVKLRVEAY